MLIMSSSVLQQRLGVRLEVTGAMLNHVSGSRGGLAGRHDWAAEKRTAPDAHRLPAIYHVKEYANEGGLLAYAPPLVDLWRSAASYVDRILRGAKPADLPVQFPTRFALVVNLRTAKAMGLTIPESFLSRADEVIE
jgi:hypothetical protein